MDKATTGFVVYLMVGSYVGYILFDFFAYRDTFRKRLLMHLLITVVGLAMLYWVYS